MRLLRSDTGFIHPHSSEITPQAVYANRRTLLRHWASGAAGAALASWAGREALASASAGASASTLAALPRLRR